MFRAIDELSLHFRRVARIHALAIVLPLLGILSFSPAMAQTARSGANATPAADVVAPGRTQLGPGDELRFQVYGQPDMDSEVVVADDGTISVPLAGPVQVRGLSPQQAAKQVEKALKDGDFLRRPIVTLTVTKARSQRVSVLGEVGTPGRYAIESDTTVLDLLAEAGGVKESGSDTVHVIRTFPDGSTEKYSVNVARLLIDPKSQPSISLQPGDSIVVPRAEQIFVYGEVNSPNNYRYEPGMTLLEAIARAGGLTPRGSDRRIEIRRQDKYGVYRHLEGKPSDQIEANDVIRVKERIF